MRNQVNVLTGEVAAQPFVTEAKSTGNKYGFLQVRIYQQLPAEEGEGENISTLEFLAFGVVAPAIENLVIGEHVMVSYRTQVEENESPSGGVFRNVKLVADEVLILPPTELPLHQRPVNFAYGLLLNAATQPILSYDRDGNTRYSLRVEVMQEWYQPKPVRGPKPISEREYKTESEVWFFNYGDPNGVRPDDLTEGCPLLVEYAVVSRTYETKDGHERIAHDLYAKRVFNVSGDQAAAADPNADLDFLDPHANADTGDEDPTADLF